MRTKESPMMMVPRSIPLAVKMGIEYLKFKRRAKKGARIFRNELLAGGVRPDHAKALTEEYLRGSRFLHQFDPTKHQT